MKFQPAYDRFIQEQDFPKGINIMIAWLLFQYWLNSNNIKIQD